MPLVPYKEDTPSIDDSCFIAPDAWVTGKCEISANVSIFFGAVLRGDIQRIIVGSETNIQDHVMIHTSRGLQDCEIGNRVTIGHRAILHGCTIEDCALIGMGACVLDGAKIGRHAIVGAQALVPMNMIIPPESLAVGVPAKVVRKLTPEEIEGLEKSADHYVNVGKQYKETLAC